MDEYFLYRLKKSLDSSVDLTEAVELFMMAICHQPYSELDKIPFSKGMRYMNIAGQLVGKLTKMFNGTAENQQGDMVPKVMNPADYFKEDS